MLTQSGRVLPSFNFFDGKPTVQPQHESFWDKLGTWEAGFVTSFVSDLGNIRETLQSQIEEQIIPTLKKTINDSSHFVFPGTRTFTFMNPQLSETDDLVVNITYLTP